MIPVCVPGQPLITVYLMPMLRLYLSLVMLHLCLFTLKPILVLTGYAWLSMQIVSGVPGTLLAQTSSVVAIVGWNALSIGPVSLSAGTYWLAVQLRGTDNIAYDGGGTGANNRYRNIHLWVIPIYLWNC